MNPIVIVPARMASMALPDKPLADIHGKPMIVHVMDVQLRLMLGRYFVRLLK